MDLTGGWGDEDLGLDGDGGLDENGMVDAEEGEEGEGGDEDGGWEMEVCLWGVGVMVFGCVCSAYGYTAVN